MNDRPSAAELIDAVRQFLEKELLPTVSDARLRFQGLVSANVLAIAGRELAREEAILTEERESLRPVVGEVEAGAGLAELRRAVREMNERLCVNIRAGDFDETEMHALLRRLTQRKLEVANPRYGADRYQ